MDLSEKYSLIEALPGDGPKSYRGRQIATGRDVAVHLLPGGKTPENEALLTRLRALPPLALRKLLEVGDTAGDTYIVTEGPPFQHITEWLAAQEQAAAAAGTSRF